MGADTQEARKEKTKMTEPFNTMADKLSALQAHGMVKEQSIAQRVDRIEREMARVIKLMEQMRRGNAPRAITAESEQDADYRVLKQAVKEAVRQWESLGAVENGGELFDTAMSRVKKLVNGGGR